MVNPAPVTASVTAFNKTYDGTSTATISSCSLSGSPANVSCTAAGPNSFSQPTAGNGLMVTATNITVSGTGASNYQLASTSATTNANINKATPTITWATPLAITYGTALSGMQLNASSTVSGAMVYTPASGAVLTAGAQTLSVTLTPMDTTDYNTTATQTVSLLVNPATPAVSWCVAPPASAAYNTQFAVAAASNSMGAISYSTSGGCSNLGGAVTMTSGTTPCSVSASVAAETNYIAGSVGPTGVSATLASQSALTVTGMPTSAQAYGTTFTVGASGGNGTGLVAFVGTGACSASGTSVTMMRARAPAR